MISENLEAIPHTPRVFCVNAVDKGVSGEKRVSAVDKELRGSGEWRVTSGER